MDRKKTITIMYECKDSESKESTYYIQLKTVYRNENGDISTKITTVQKPWSSVVPKIAESFDQDAAIVFLARLCVHRALMEEQQNVRQWLDTNLCKWASYFGNYVKNDQTSFSLPPTMSGFPQYIYHLRRSNFVNRFGSSLDEVKNFFIIAILQRTYHREINS